MLLARNAKNRSRRRENEEKSKCYFFALKAKDRRMEKEEKSKYAIACSSSKWIGVTGERG